MEGALEGRIETCPGMEVALVGDLQWRDIAVEQLLPAELVAVVTPVVEGHRYVLDVEEDRMLAQRLVVAAVET